MAKCHDCGATRVRLERFTSGLVLCDPCTVSVDSPADFPAWVRNEDHMGGVSYTV